MDFFQIIAAGVLIVLAVVVGAGMAILWHSSTRSSAQAERPVPSRRAKPQSKGVSSQAKPLRSSARPAPGTAPEKGEAAQAWADRTAEVSRLIQDRARIQAAIRNGDAKTLYELASEYKKLGFHQAANELFQKAKWVGLNDQVAEHVGPLQNQRESPSDKLAKGSAGRRSAKPTE